MAIKYYSGINISGSIVPSADSTFNLGGPAFYFSNVYADTYYGDGSNLTGLTVDEATTANTALALSVTVKNISGGSLSKGTVVHAAPSANPPSGNVIEVIAADYDTASSMPGLGVLNETLANDAEGEAIMFGAVSGIDTSSFIVGSELYVGNNGAFTVTKPTTAGQLIQKIGVVIKSNASNGLIKVFGAGRTNDVPLPLYIDNTNQRVGIGTTSPLGKLDVRQAQQSAPFTTPFLKLYPTATTNLTGHTTITLGTSPLDNYGVSLSGWRYGTDGDPKFRIKMHNNSASGVDALTIDSSGNVGIGTTSPSAKLEINHDTFGEALILHRNDSGNAASLTFKNNSGQAGILYATYADTTLRWRDGVTTNAYKIWHEGNDGSGSGLDADTLDSLQASQFLRSDTSDTMTGNLSISGNASITGSGDYTLSLSRISGKPTIKANTDDGGYLIMDSNGGYAALNWYTTDNVGLAVGGGKVSVGTSTIAQKLHVNGDIGATVYYDKDNTNRYVNPSDAGRSIHVEGYITAGIGDSKGFEIGAGGTHITAVGLGDVIFQGANQLRFGPNNYDWNQWGGIKYTGGTSPILYIGGPASSVFTSNASPPSTEINFTGTTFVMSDTSFRAPIFYDNNNTGYYIHGDSTSRLNILNVNATGTSVGGVGKVMFPYGAEYSGSSTVTGAFKITLPQSWTNTMMTMKITIFDYSINESFEVHCGGYNHTGSGGYWVNTHAKIIANGEIDRNFNVRFGHDGSKCCILIGETNSSWSYPKVVVTEWIGGHANETFSNWDNGWDISTVTTLPSNIDQTRSNNQIGRYQKIIYDTDNTGYFLDPATAGNGTVLNGVKLDYLGVGTSANTSGSYRINMSGSIDMNANNIDYINQLHFNDNVRFYDDGNDNYLNFKWGDTGPGGIKFYDGNTTLHGYIYGDGNGRFGLLDNDGQWAVYIGLGTEPLQLRCNNNPEFYIYDSYTYSPGSSRAPVFYDSNNTGYYVDPASTSSMLNINMNNGTLSNVNHITINDPGVSEGIAWNGGNGWSIYESNDSNNNGAGNLQFATGTTHRFRIDTSGNTFSFGSSRAPIFYDSDNTAYYLNAASTSRINRIDYTELHSPSSSNNGRFLNHSSWGTLHQTDSGYIQFGPANTSFAHIYTDRGSFYFNKTIYVNGGSEINTGDIRSAIFYDKDNTARYLNPAGDSILSHIRLHNHCSLESSHGRGFRFWNSNSYKIHMSASSQATHGGRVAGETTSDYNMYFTMSGGTNRGFVFKNANSSSGGNCVAGIDASGNGRFIGDVIAYSSSDKRLKDNITLIDNPIDKVQKISGVTFDWNDKQDTYEHGKHDVGVIAQEIEEVLPEVVDTRENGYKAVKYEKIVPLLIEAIKEQQKQIDELKKLINP